MLSAKNLNPVIASKDSNWPTLLEVVPDQAWEPSWSPRSVRNTPTGSWTPTPLCLHPRCQILWLNPTMLLCLFISWLRILMRPSVLTMKPSMTFASVPSNWPPQPMVTWTTWSPWPCLVSPPAFVSLVSSMLISGNWLSTWCPSPGSTSSSLVSGLLCKLKSPGIDP